MLENFIGHCEIDFGIKPQELLGASDLLRSKCCAVNRAGVHPRGRVADHGAQTNESGARVGLSLGYSLENALDVFTAIDFQGLPTVGLVSRDDILSEGDAGIFFNGNAVVVPEDNQIAQLLGSSEGARLCGDALLNIAIRADHVDEVIEQGLASGSFRIE